MQKNKNAINRANIFEKTRSSSTFFKVQDATASFGSDSCCSDVPKQAISYKLFNCGGEQLKKGYRLIGLFTIFLLLIAILGCSQQKGTVPKSKAPNQPKSPKSVPSKVKLKIKPAVPADRQVEKPKLVNAKPIQSQAVPNQNQTNLNEEKLLVKLKINTGKKNLTYQVGVERDKTVYDVLKTASSGNHFSLKVSNYSYGVFIEEIASTRNNPSSGYYWLYYINGKYANVGASSMKIKEGDEIKWVYTKTN